MNFHLWQWTLAILGAFLVGVSKTGITGLSLIFVVLFASVMPAKQATGLVLPLLLLGDLVAYGSYQAHAHWRHLLKLFPWAAAGVVVGYLALGRMNDRQAVNAIGCIILGLGLLYVVKKLLPGDLEREHGPWFAPLIGVLAGFTTLVSNSSGPLLVIYLLSVKLPKMEYLGTMAVFFLILNIFKLPFMISLGLVNRESLILNLALAPAVLGGSWFGKWLVMRINQRIFENVVLGLALLSGLRLLF